MSKFSLPVADEGFDELRYPWFPGPKCDEHLKEWINDRKVTTRVEDIQPSSWFKVKSVEWLKDVQAWRLMATSPKIKKPKPAASEAATGEQKPDASKEGVGEEDADLGLEAKKQVAPGEKDMTTRMKEAVEKLTTDVFGIEDINNIDGEDTPLYMDWEYEDWILLSLRFEVHLLIYSFLKDCPDKERPGMPPEHLAFYYERYFNKTLNLKTFSCETAEDLLGLIKDTIVQKKTNRVLFSLVAEDVESNTIFVKLTEHARRIRQRRIGLGTEQPLRFQGRPTQTKFVPASIPVAGFGTTSSSSSASPTMSVVKATSKVFGGPPQGTADQAKAGAPVNTVKAAAQGGGGPSGPPQFSPPGMAGMQQAMMQSMQSMMQAAQPKQQAKQPGRQFNPNVNPVWGAAFGGGSGANNPMMALATLMSKGMGGMNNWGKGR